MVTMPIPNEGTPSNWTLRFKHGRHTVLLYSDPLTPFAVLKSELLVILCERYPNGLPSTAITIPHSADDIALAIPRDKNDPTRGWQELRLTGRGEGLKDTPKAVGLKDGGIVAFRVGPTSGDQNDAPDGLAEEFVVEWPSFDDAYGADVMDQD